LRPARIPTSDEIVGVQAEVSSRRIGIIAAVSAVLAMVTVAAASSTALGFDDQLQTRSMSTFSLQPGKDRVAVMVDLSITNRIPDRVDFLGTTHYYNQDFPVLIQKGATNVRVSGEGTKIRRVHRGEVADTYKVTYPRVFKGQTAKVRVSYELKAAGPGSARTTRVTNAYSHFCWHGQPTDRADARAILPKGYRPDTVGDGIRSKSVRGATWLMPQRMKDAKRLHCVESSKPSKLARNTITTPSGESVVVEGWPEDPQWLSAVSSLVEATLPVLQAWVGSPMPAHELVVRQSAIQALGGYAGDFDGRSDEIRVGETTDNPETVTHELAHAWFNRSTMGETWMIEGSAEWASRVANGYWCSDPSAIAASARSNLRDWQYLGIDADERENAVVSHQYAASCWIHQEVTKAVGFERMVSVNRALLERTPKYGGAGDPDAAVPDWREWLDAVDEIGLVPAGVDDFEFAERLLVDFGIADPNELSDRAGARAYYHAALDAWGEYLPEAVRVYMDAWEFDSAVAAMDVADVIVGDLNAVAYSADPADLYAMWEAMATARSLADLEALHARTAVLS
jgi:hypothetical protein